MRANYHRRRLSSADRARNKAIAKVRCQVERTFAILKQWYGFTRVRYRSLARNALRQREESVRCPVRTGFFGRKARHHPSEDNFPAP